MKLAPCIIRRTEVSVLLYHTTDLTQQAIGFEYFPHAIPVPGGQHSITTHSQPYVPLPHRNVLKRPR